MDTQDLRRLAARYSLSQLEACISEQLRKGVNACDVVDESDAVISELSKASVVRELMDSGLSFSDALRELGRRIREIYAKEEDLQ